MSTALSESLARIAVVIPAWQPGASLLSLALALHQAGFGLVLVVDDGSEGSTQAVFAELLAAGFPVLCHGVNLGKGRALKTAFGAVLEWQPGFDGVVTADADGQHTPVDIVRVGRALAATLHQARPGLVLGTRAFTAGVPLRSRLGNVLTRAAFRRLTGVRLADTQSGLRGIPACLLPELLHLEGERYEYEMNVLLHLCRGRMVPAAVPIETVYLDRNVSSHFDPVRDSMRIYRVLLRALFRRSTGVG